MENAVCVCAVTTAFPPAAYRVAGGSRSPAAGGTTVIVSIYRCGVPGFTCRFFAPLCAAPSIQRKKIGMSTVITFDRIDDILAPHCSDEALESAGAMRVVATILTPTAK